MSYLISIMAAKKLPNHKTAKQQEQLVSPIDRGRFTKYGSYSYQPEYADVVFKLLSESEDAKTKSHCCAALQCSRPTLNNWEKKFPEFAKAIRDGKEIGLSKWRERIVDHAYKPTADVNNGLIKLLSSNVYGMKDEPNVVINNNNTLTSSPEEILKKRGIPVPQVDLGDIDE